MAYIDKHGVEYTDDQKTLVRCPEDFKGEFIIPDDVTEIGDGAFASCKHVTDIILHGNITKIGYDALPDKFEVRWETERCKWYIPFGTYEKFNELYNKSYNFKELDMYSQKFDDLYMKDASSYKEVYDNRIDSFVFPEDTKHFFASRTGEKKKVYFTGELQSLTLLKEREGSYPDRVFYINNYIENVDVNYVREVHNSLIKCENLNKRYDEHLFFKAPLLNTKPAIGKIVELTYCGQNQNFRYTEYVWSTPISINVDDVACIVETRLRCYEGMHSGCRIMLLGGKSDQLAKQELPCWVDVWEDYDFVMQKLLQAGWQR